MRNPISKKYAAVGGTVAAAAIVGVIAGTASAQTRTVTQRVNVPGPVTTKIVPRNVPGPTKTVIKTVFRQAPPPPPGAKIAVYSGTGNEVTPAFNVPDSGNYIVRWSYSGNIDTSFGGSQATNFNISETGSGYGGDLPNDIAASGSGSTEVTGAGSTDSLNVQAAGSWTITVVSAS